MPAIANALSCPSGMMTVEFNNFVTAESGSCPSGYIAHDVSDICASASSEVCWLVRLACGAGITQMHTSAGVSFPLYATRETSPSLGVEYNGIVCYLDLEIGEKTGTINLNHSGVIYHVVN